MTILIINGPNLNLLGTREPDIYGTQTMDEALHDIHEEFPDVTVHFHQSNAEGEIINCLQKNNFAAVIINPGAYSHYSYAIADCLKNIKVPKVEVHISNIYQREEYRQKSVTAPCCDAVLSGFGIEGYGLAVHFIIKKSSPK